MKKNLSKRLCSLLLVFVTMLCCMVPALAVEETTPMKNISEEIQAQMRSTINLVHGAVTKQEVIAYENGEYAIQTTYVKDVSTKSTGTSELITQVNDIYDTGDCFMYTVMIKGLFTYSKEDNTCTAISKDYSVTNYGGFEISDEKATTDEGGFFTKWAKVIYKFKTKVPIGNMTTRTYELKVYSDGTH